MKKAFVNSPVAGFFEAMIHQEALQREQTAPPEPDPAAGNSVSQTFGGDAPTPADPAAVDPSAAPPATDAAIPPDASAAPPADAPVDPNATPADAPAPVDPNAPEPLPGQAQDPDAQFAEYVEEYISVVSANPGDEALLRQALDVGREQANLRPYQRAFIETNIQALSLLSDKTIAEVQKKVAKAATAQEKVQQIEAFIDASPDLMDAIVRLTMLGPDRSNVFRQFLAAICGGAVVPGPSGGEVVFIPKGQKDKVVLRPSAHITWGMLDLGPVVMDTRSIEEYLDEGEQARLKDGAPEERKVLRNRLFISACADQLAGAVYYILVIDPATGTWETVTFTSDTFKDAYESGDLTAIESQPIPTGSLCIDADGRFVAMATWGLARIVKDAAQVSVITGEKESPLRPMAALDAQRLILQAGPDDLRGVGLDVRSHTWASGDQERLRVIQRSVPDARRKLLAQINQ